MSILLDIILIAIVAVFAIIGAKKGFFMALSGLASNFIGLLAAIFFYKPVSGLMKKIPFLANMIKDVEMPSDLAMDKGIMDNFKAIIKYIVENSEDIEEKTQAIINNLLAEAISIALAFLVLFIGVSLLVKLVFRLLDLVSKAPVLKQLNGALGGVVGVVIGLFWTWVFSLAFGGFLFPLCNKNWPEIFPYDMLESVVFKIFSDFNPIGLIAKLLEKFI